MIAPAHTLLMARYNRWMNEKLYEPCARLTDHQRRRDQGAFFRSVHATLNHILYGDLALRCPGSPVSQGRRRDPAP